MSKILSCDAKNECKTWQAPQLDLTEDINFDYKLTDPNNITHREQQKLIRQQAYEKSYAKGYMEGLARGQQESAVQSSHLNSIMASLSMPLSDLDGKVAAEMAELCTFIAKQLIRRELKTSPEEVIAVVREALKLMPDSVVQITLVLHPNDAELIRSTLVQPFDDSNWKIVEDPVLTRGGCRVLSQTSSIDATVESRINSVIASVLGCERSQDQERD